MDVKKENYVTFQMGPVIDVNGAIIINLATTTEVTFAVKTDKTDIDADALILKRKTLGELTVDDPDTGYVTVTLSDSDTNLLGDYFMALQLEWAADKQEINLTEDGKISDRLSIKQDIIR